MSRAAAVPKIRHPAEVMEANAHVLADLLAALREAKSAHALVGGLVAGHYGRVRATIDVDLLVPKRKLPKIAAAMRKRGYVVRTAPDMTRVYAGGAKEGDDPIADLVAKESNPVLRAAFDERVPADMLGQRVEMVKRGAFVALKFHAAVSPTRKLGDRYQDVADIERVVSRALEPEDEELAARIADVMYPGARAELSEMIADLRAGRPVKF